jgi:hypothetical protein
VTTPIPEGAPVKLSLPAPNFSMADKPDFKKLSPADQAGRDRLRSNGCERRHHRPP